MAVSEQRLKQAVEQLYDDERLRSNLTDVTATRMLAWAEAQLQRAAQGDEAVFASATQQLRATLHEVNSLAEARKSLSAPDMERRLAALPESAALSFAERNSQRRALVERRAALRDGEFVERLLALLDPVGGAHPRAAPPAPAPAKRGPGLLAGASMLALGGLGLMALLCVGLGALAFFFWPDGSSGPSALATPTRRAPASLPSAVPVGTAWYDLYFTRPGTGDERLPRALADLIGSAQQQVDVAIYQLDEPLVLGALLDAQRRGVALRVVTDLDIWLDDEESLAFVALEEAGVPVVAGNSSAIMHNKFVVVDGNAVWTGSWNFTEHDTSRYDNHALVIRSPELARNYTLTFEKMWRDQIFGARREPDGLRPTLRIAGIPVESYFSPENEVGPQIVRRIDAAQGSVRFMAFSFTDDRIGAAMLAAAARGVEVRGVFETTGSETQYSEYGPLRAEGLDVRQDGNGYLMHHKVIIIDGRTVIFGSYNFSQNAETSNDENLLIVDDPTLAAQFVNEWERVYQVAGSR